MSAPVEKLQLLARSESNRSRRRTAEPLLWAVSLCAANDNRGGWRLLLRRLAQAVFSPALFLCITLVTPFSPADATPAACAAPRGLVRLHAPLPRTAERLAAHE